MSKQVSPFAALTGAEKQIRWLEYQSIRLPYVEGKLDEASQTQTVEAKAAEKPNPSPAKAVAVERPQPPPEVPRTLPADYYQKSRHSQYDAVIARLKQAELQSRYYRSQSTQQSK